MLSQSMRAGRVPLLALLVLALGAFAANAETDPLLAKFVGKWIGRGTYRASPQAKPELVYCSVSNKLADGGNSLEQRGRCALSDKFGKISGKITAHQMRQEVAPSMRAASS